MANKISIPNPLHERLSEIASVSGESVEQLLVELLESGLEADERGHQSVYSQQPANGTAPISGGLLTPEEASDFLKLSQSRLAKLRCSGKGPSFVKLGARTVMYRFRDLNEYIRSNIQRSTSEF